MHTRSAQENVDLILGPEDDDEGSFATLRAIREEQPLDPGIRLYNLMNALAESVASMTDDEIRAESLRPRRPVRRARWLRIRASGRWPSGSRQWRAAKKMGR